MRRVSSSVLAALVGLALATSGAAAAPKLTVKGDAKAWAEIEAALVKLTKLKSYRAKVTMTGGGGGTWEFASPNRFRSVMDLGGMRTETVWVGKQMRFRQGNGPWQCVSDPTPPPATDTSQMTGEVTAQKGPAVAVDGVQTQSYTFTWKTSAGTGPGAFAMTITNKVFVTIATGLPKRSQMVDDKGAVAAQTDYYDYDAPVRIDLPACG